MSIAGFYSSRQYKETQRSKTKAAWERGSFDFLYKRNYRVCARAECGIKFEVSASNPKKYCSSSCCAKVSNRARGSLSVETKKKIAVAMTGKHSLYKGVIKIPRVEVICNNPACGKRFSIERWKTTKFCSIACSMHVIGGRPTSPKAARAKAGIRTDVSRTIYFYSRWEANMARLFNYFSIEWVHQPRTFILGNHTYTPDFYLPQYDIYVEVKNFMNEYSANRDLKFRSLFSNLKLEFILKEDYVELERIFSARISNWEYKNSKFKFIESGDEWPHNK